jgi:hypothetical protein
MGAGLDKRILIQLLTYGQTATSPYLDDRDCWYKLLRLSTRYLYPETNLLGVWENEKITHCRYSRLSVQKSLGSLRMKLVDVTMQRNKEKRVKLTVFRASAVTASIALTDLAMS